MLYAGDFRFMYYVYILHSIEKDKYYIGSTENVDQRLQRHNNKMVRSTKAYAPWALRYTESFSTRALAENREKGIKNKKSRKYIELLVDTSR